MNTKYQQLPVPDFYDQSLVGQVWRVPYEQRAQQAREWARIHGITHWVKNPLKLHILLIDVMNTFCIPDFELFVAGRSQIGAVEDNQRLVPWIYSILGLASKITPTLDTHRALAIFFEIFWVNDKGEHPTPFSDITYEEVKAGVWRPNPAMAADLTNGDYVWLQKFAMHYVTKLTQKGRYNLTIWPYHAMLGGIGHAMVAAVEEAVFFHSIARSSLTNFEIKGGNPLTENYSVFSPEVTDTHDRSVVLAQKNTRFINTLLEVDKLVIAGQAKSHCVTWSIDDLLNEIWAYDKSLVSKVYLLEDCTSPVVVWINGVPVVDHTAAANEAFDRFRDAGMNVIRTTDPIDSWLLS